MEYGILVYEKVVFIIIHLKSLIENIKNTHLQLNNEYVNMS